MPIVKKLTEYAAYDGHACTRLCDSEPPPVTVPLRIRSVAAIARMGWRYDCSLLTLTRLILRSAADVERPTRIAEAEAIGFLGGSERDHAMITGPKTANGPLRGRSDCVSAAPIRRLPPRRRAPRRPRAPARPRASRLRGACAGS